MSDSFIPLKNLSNSAEWSIRNLHPEMITTLEETKEGKIEIAKNKITDCYFQIYDFLGQWVDLPEDYKKVVSLWIIGTYFHKEFSTYPYLFFNAGKGSGKTRTMNIISYLQANGNGIVLNNPSDAVLFRTAIERGLIIDEFESEKSKDKQTMREYLNSCYKKGGVVYRMEKQKVDNKEKMVAVPHPLYTPVALANISGIENVLEDRAITLILEKSMNPALVKKIEDFDRNPTIKSIKANLLQFSVDLCSVYPLQNDIDYWNEFINQKYTPLHILHTLHYSTQLYTANSTDIIKEEFYKKIDATGIFGRNLEIFLPLLVLAFNLSNALFDEFLKIVVDLNNRKKDVEFAENNDVSLIEFVSKREDCKINYVFIQDLLKDFKEFLGAKGEEEDKWITVTWFGSALKRLKLTNSRKRVARGVQVILAVDYAKEKLKLFEIGESNEKGP